MSCGHLFLNSLIGLFCRASIRSGRVKRNLLSFQRGDSCRFFPSTSIRRTKYV